MLATALAIMVLLALIPAAALIKLSGLLDWRILAGYALVISLFTWFLYRKDKQQAERGGWRTPEATLHALEVFGGWPAAFVAQRWFRHKITKRIYQVNFWAIVVLHQFIAFDYLQDWHWSQTALSWLNAPELIRKVTGGGR